MTVKPSDILVLDVRSDWILAGAEYAEKTWAVTFNRMGKADPYYRMRRIMFGITAQRGFEHLLGNNGIKYSTKDRDRFWYEIDMYDILVRNRKYELKTNYIDDDGLRPSNTSWLLDASALVPQDQLFSRGVEAEDVYVFAYLTGKSEGLQNYDPRSVLYRDKTDGLYLTHGFWKYEHLKPRKWVDEHGKESLGCIHVFSSSPKDAGKEFLIGGTKREKEFYSESVKLGGSCKATTKTEFYQLIFIRPLDNLIPDGRLTITCEKMGKIGNEIINPLGGFQIERIKKGDKSIVQVIQNDWNDIWLYNAHLYFAGWIYHEDFKNRSQELDRFDKTVKQFEIKTPNKRMYVKELSPMSELITFLS